VEGKVIGKLLGALTTLLQMVHENLSPGLPAALRQKAGSFVIVFFAEL
jgi:hypothetical protein